MSDFLFNVDGYYYLQEFYVNRQYSTYEIAKENNTYANKVRRALIYHRIPLRNYKESQKAAQEAGRYHHPTQGRERTTEEKRRISQGQIRAWMNLSEEQRERRREFARQQWLSMSQEQRTRFREEAKKAISLASMEGSRLERQLVEFLRAHKQSVQHRCLVAGKPVEILLAHSKVVIEVDGPAYHYPIWGEDLMIKNQERVRGQNELLVALGFLVIRLQQFGRYRESQKKRAFEHIMNILSSRGNHQGVILLDIGVSL
jgi:hypothetical protein